MLRLDEARRTILREVDAVGRRVDRAAPEDLDRPVRCDGWAVRDMLVHLAGGLPMAADALRRMAAGIAEPAADPTTPDEAAPALLSALRSGRAELAAALGLLSPDHLANACPFSFVTLPGIAGINLLALEAGTHRNDLEWALGNECPLPPDVVRAAAGILLGILLYGARRAAAPPEEDAGYAIAGEALRFGLTYREGAWRAEPPNGGRSCTIAGDDSALALFALGRIRADHPSLVVSGDHALAGSFKRYFPGP